MINVRVSCFCIKAVVIWYVYCFDCDFLILQLLPCMYVPVLIFLFISYFIQCRYCTYYV
jgi:hypothetical protein